MWKTSQALCTVLHKWECKWEYKWAQPLCKQCGGFSKTTTATTTTLNYHTTEQFHFLLFIQKKNEIMVQKGFVPQCKVYHYLKYQDMDTSKDEWIKKTWYTHKTEYYPAIKKQKSLKNKN